MNSKVNWSSGIISGESRSIVAVGHEVTLGMKHRRHDGPRKNVGSESPSILEKTRYDATAFWTALSSIAACLAALFAGWAALETRESALEANRATKASVWLQLLNEYESAEMLASMKELRAWQQQRPKDFADAFERLLVKAQKTDEEKRLVDALDLDRRRVAGFFTTVQTLCEGGIVDETFAKRSFGGSTYRFLVDVEIPMQDAKADAMVETKSMSLEDKAIGKKREKETLQFYERVFH
jgi:hypothetical protein